MYSVFSPIALAREKMGYGADMVVSANALYTIMICRNFIQ